MTESADIPFLVGVDRGATEVKAHEVVVLADGLAPGPARAAFRAAPPADFAPVDLALQLDEHARDVVSATPAEHAASEHAIDAVVESILSIAARARRRRLVVGMCSPGLKTRDGRGVAVMKNGPRAPDFLDRVEARLARAGIVLDRPIARLLSDGEAAGRGEEAAADGAFRGVAEAYYVGGGTGLAECFKLGNRVTPLDRVSADVRQGWRMTSESGETFEERMSMPGLAARFGARAGPRAPRAEFVEEAARRGDPRAVETLRECAAALAELVAIRAREWPTMSRAPLARVVVGQRLGGLYADERLQAWLLAPCRTALDARGGASIEIVASPSRAVSAVGAAACAREGTRSEPAHG